MSSNCIDICHQETECNKGSKSSEATLQNASTTTNTSSPYTEFYNDKEEDTLYILRDHLNYHKELLRRVIEDDEVEQYFRYKHVTYKLQSNGSFTPEFSICGNPPIIIHSLSNMDGLNYGEKVDGMGYMAPDYENLKGGHYKCGKLARENPGICVYSVCGHSNSNIMFYEYNSLEAPVTISRDTYEKKILQNVNLTKFRLATQT
jgi:hypothetical protein